MPTPKSQSEKFKEAAREHGADEDEERFKERLGRLVRPKPVKEPEAKEAQE